MAAEVKREKLGPRGLVWRCSECREWTDDGVLKHARGCSLKGQASVWYPDAEGDEEPEVPGAPKEPEAPKPTDFDHMQRHAKQGDLALHYSDEEVDAAASLGWLSMSDAMNQDF